MVGYVLLITCAIIMGVVVYQWIKTYVPTDALACPEGVSIFIKEHRYDCDKPELNLTLKNNGLFNIAGYFIHATNGSEQELAIIDLSNYTLLGENMVGTVLFSMGNSFESNDETTNIFDLSNFDLGNISSIEIIPVRFQEEEGKERFVSCGGAKVKEMLSCWVACVADDLCKDITCVESTCTDECDNDYDGILGPDECELLQECGPAPNGCGDSDECGTCPGVGEVCNIIEGTCIACTPVCSSCDSSTCVGETCVETNCNSLCDGIKEPDCTGPDGIEGTADDLVCGPASNGCGNETVCESEPCDGTCVGGECIISSCNGLWEGVNEDPEVECDGPPPIANCMGCVCNDPYVPDDNGECVLPTDFGCPDYCRSLLGYNYGVCVQNTGGACPPPNVYESGGDQYCPVDNPLQKYCCCEP